MALHDLLVDDLALRVEPPAAPGAPIVVRWTGKAGQKEPGLVLSPYLEELTVAAAAAGVGLEFRFEALDHFNSATILVIMQLIPRLKAARTRLRIRFDPKRKWQKMTFEALQRLDRGAEVIELAGIE